MTMKEIRIGVLLMIPPGEDPSFAYTRTRKLKWLTSAGATIVPISPAISAVEAAAYFEHIHGLFLQDGWAETEAYTQIVNLFITMATLAKKQGDHFPIWGICRGFQHIIQYFGGSLENLDATNFPKHSQLIIHDEHKDSRIIHYASPSQKQHLAHFKPEFNHEHGISLYNFMNNSQLRKTFRILSTSHDRAGREYVSMIEGRNLPIYGVQFHPEWSQPQLNWMAAFFTSEAAKSTHTGFDPMVTPVLKKGTCSIKYEEMSCLRIDL